MIAGVLVLCFAAQIIGNQQSRNRVLTTEIKKLDAQIKDIATLQAEIEALRARQQAVEDLQADRNMPVHLLNELVRQLPEGVYLTSVRQDGQVVTLNGMAQSNERVSELLRNLARQLARGWSSPELIEIKAPAVPARPQSDQTPRRPNSARARVRGSSARRDAGAGRRAMPAAGATRPARPPAAPARQAA